MFSSSKLKKSQGVRGFIMRKFSYPLIIFGVIFFMTRAGFSKSLYSPKKNSIKIIVPKNVVIGDPFELKIYIKKHISNIQLSWLNRKLDLTRLNQDTITIFLGSDIKKDKPGIKLLTIKYGNKKILKRIYLKKRKFTVTRIHVSKKFSSLSKKDLNRYFREKRIVESILFKVTKKCYYEKNFIPPILPLIISSPYGRVRIINNKNRSIHTGIDIKAKEGTPVKAINSGIVALTMDQFFSGKSIYIDHGYGIVSMYFHLKKILVKKGQKVKKGQIIALSGKSGRVSGPHLHLGVSILGKMVDPEKLIKKF